MENKLTDAQVETLIALALRPDLQPPPTDAEIEQFITEFDEGKHPLSDESKDALSTAGFRKYLKAQQENQRLREALGIIRGQALGSNDSDNRLHRAWVIALIDHELQALATDKRGGGYET